MIATLVLLSALAAVHVPDGNYILVNGMADEWHKAVVVPLDPETKLLAMKDRDSLFLAVAFMGSRHTGIDLYVRSAGRTRMLHVSSVLGEKSLGDNGWGETEWGQNRWWTANTIGSVSDEGGTRWLAPEAFEFQLARGQLGTGVELFIHLKRPEKKLPARAAADLPEGWLRFTLI